MPGPKPNPLVDQNASIGRAVVNHINGGNHDDTPLWDAHWHPDFVSVEGDGTAYEGRPAVKDKCEWWVNNHTVHSCTASGPFAGERGFVVHYEMDVEPKDGSWPRMTMKEVGVYTVDNGKVVREEFWYAPMGG